MADWMIHKIDAPSEVLQSLVNDEGQIDFNMLITFQGSFQWSDIDRDAQDCAEYVTTPFRDRNQMRLSNPNLPPLGSDVLSLNDEAFEQYVQMLRNKRQHGYFHPRNFRGPAWGTDSNAVNQTVDLEAGVFIFHTVWSYPEPVLKALSAKHPEATITVRTAFEDHGKKCGTVVYKGGDMVSSDVAPAWNEMSQSERRKWTAFARELYKSAKDLGNT